MLLQLESKHLKIVNSILKMYPYQFYAYGSRAKNTSRTLSDLDICYKDSIPDFLAFLIEEEFKESDLPFKVDFVSWNRMNPSFQKLIEKDLIRI
ncbi:MAG: hypothetical protein AM1032_000014 [Mycoplasmataceae bacterium]|nr:MAG: hypothetical protein AM1032_000014 [Mycoplasmataceae bacterium]